MKQLASSKQRHTEFVRTRGEKTPDPKAASPQVRPSEAPKAPKPDKQKRRRYLRQYRQWLWPYRWAFAAILALALITTGLDMIWPLAIRHIMDHVLVNAGAAHDDRLAQLMRVGGLIIFVLILKQILDTTRSLRTAALDAKVTIRLRRRLFDKFLRLSLGQLSDFKTGGVVSRLSSDVDSINGLVQMAIISPTVAVIRLILTLSVLIWMSWRLAVGSLIMLPPLAILSYLWLRKVRPVYRSAQQDRQDVDARVTETFGGIRVVRAFRREPREEKSYALGRHTVLRKFLWAIRMETALETVWGLLIPGTVLMIVWFGGYLVIQGKAKVGDLFAFQIFAALLLQPVWAIVSSVSQTNKSMSALERVFEVLEMPIDKPDADDAVDAPGHVDEVRFDHITFEYRPGTEVIKDFTLSIPGGSVVALVGPSGAGKTTLTDLVARFYDPTSGAILLNGIDLRRLRLRTYRSLLAVVQQDTFLFDGTVRENIAYGRRGVTQEQIEDAARRANALEFIRQLPESFDTLIGERGFKLSGGQKQRISIARAILADPRILILDEATSNLDTESEQLIQSSLNDLLRHRTTFVIAHRLSTITHADVIVVMDQGRIVETGTHEELMSRGGMYAEMVERQRNSMGVNGELAEVVAPASRP
jgi:ATP-binding cassette, subfamily B, bacterial